MAIATEPFSLGVSAGVALEAEVAVIVVPWTVRIESGDATIMNARICPFNPVEIGMAAGAGAGRIPIIMT